MEVSITGCGNLYDTLDSYWITPPTFMIMLLQICNFRSINKMLLLNERANIALNHSSKFHGLTPHEHIIKLY